MHRLQTEGETKEELLEIVRKLPKTADGVSVTPNMDVFCPNGHKAGIVSLGDDIAMCIEGDCELTWEEDGWDVCEWSTYPLSDCYSTREAAYKAFEASKETEI